MTDPSLSSQILALGREMGKVEKGTEQALKLGEQATEVLTQVQLAIDHLEDRTDGLGEVVKSISPLGTAITTLTGQVKQLREEFEALAAEPAEEKLAMWDWSSMTKGEAGDAWATLTKWVREILTYQYGWVGPAPDLSRIDWTVETPGTAPRRIPPCWYKHRDVVIELSWLCQEWIRIYTTSYGTASKAGDWHDRYAPGVRRRVLTSMYDCFHGHKDPVWGSDWHHPQAPRAIDDDEHLSAVISHDLQYRKDDPPQGPVAATN
ncbi:hypothetical protein AB0G29_35475 [Streptomyces parvus]|uniref:hypothetical protein n=1 Tax=Streptomyces parvus TaxID=66428 RepID=UPI0033E5A9B2